MTIYRIAGTNSQYGGTNPSDGINTMATYRSRHVATRDMTAMGLYYINGRFSAENGNATVTFKAAIECTRFPLGYAPITFGGVRTTAVATGSAAMSDLTALPATIKKGDTYWVRTRCSVGVAGQVWGLTASMTASPNPPYGDGVSLGVDATDAVGTMAAGGNLSALVVPHAIFDQNTGDLPGVVAYGDSIPTGGSDIQDAVYGRGWLVRALDRSLTGAGIPFANLSLGGESMNTLIGGAGVLRRGLPGIIGFRDAVVTYGTNDILALGRTGAQVIADLQSFYTTLSLAGLRVWGVTLLPRTNSSDLWATTGGQTPMSGYAPGGHRDVVNAWIRSMPVPLAGVIDAADAVETARNSGFWKVNTVANYMTTDGTHPTSAASKLIASIVPISRFLRATPLQAVA